MVGTIPTIGPELPPHLQYMLLELAVQLQVEGLFQAVGVEAKEALQSILVVTGCILQGIPAVCVGWFGRGLYGCGCVQELGTDV